jgi:hypothetical protein
VLPWAWRLGKGDCFVALELSLEVGWRNYAYNMALFSPFVKKKFKKNFRNFTL